MRNRLTTFPRRPSRHLLGRGVDMAAYRTFALGVGGNRTAGVATKGDTAVLSAAALSGELNRHFRIPSFGPKKLANGDLLLFAEGIASNAADYYTHSIYQFRSSDNGNHWTIELVWRNPSFVAGTDWVNLGGIGVSSATGKIVLLLMHSTNGGGDGTPVSNSDITVEKLTSVDNGLTYGGAVAGDGTPVVQADAKKASGQAAPFDDTLGAWGWCIYSGCTEDENGNLIFCGNHRYTPDVLGTSWSHVAITSDGGDTFTLSGPQESVPANDFSNESVIARGLNAGELYMQCRIIGQDYRGQFFSTDSGATWSTREDCDGLGGRPNLPGLSCDWSLDRTPNGKLYCCGPADTAIRAHLTLYESVDGGHTWPVSRKISTLPGGYSSLIAIDNESLLLVAECTSTNIASQKAASPSVYYYEYFQQWQIPITRWLHAPTTQPLYTRLCFNDGAVGAADTLGNQIKNHGTDGPAARGGTYGEFTATGGKTLGTGVAFTLAELQEDTGGTDGSLGNAADIGPGDWTLEIPGFVMPEASGARVIAGNRNSTAVVAGTAAGWTLQVSATDVLQFMISDGTNACSPTATTQVDGGATYDLRVERDSVNHVCRIYIDGVLAVTESDAPGNTGSIVGLANTVVGARPDGVSPGIFDFSEIVITRGIKTSGFITSASTKPTAASLIGYTPAADPFAHANLVAHVFATHDGGHSGGRDLYGGWDKHALPIVNGKGVQSFRDTASNRLFRASNVNRGAWADFDDDLGPHWRTSYDEDAAGAMAHRAAITAHDFPQNTGNWSFFTGIKFISTAGGGYQTILDNCLASADNPGVSILRLSATELFVRVSDGNGGVPTGITCALTFTVPLTVGSPLFLGIAADLSTGIKACYGVLNGTTAPTLTFTAPQAYATNTPGTFASEGYLCLGSYWNDSSAHADARWRDANLRSDAMSNADMQAACNAMSAVAEF